VATAACPASALLLPRIRRFKRPWRRAAALAAGASFAWVAILEGLPKLIPEHPLPFGVYGWLPQLALLCGSVLVTGTAWAVWGLLAAARSRAPAA
jgi:hypothetical protein